MKVFIIFMVAVLFYDMYSGNAPNLMRSLFYLAIGTGFLYVLCAANMEFAAWGILLLPIVFYIFLLVILVFNRGFQITSTYEERETCAPEPTCEEEKEEETCSS
jgi:hypothetical protein